MKLCFSFTMNSGGLNYNNNNTITALVNGALVSFSASVELLDTPKELTLIRRDITIHPNKIG